MKSLVITIGLSFLLAIVSGIGVFTYVNNVEDRVLAGQDPVRVYVTSGSITTGTTLREALEAGLARETKVARSALPTGSLSNISAVNENYVALNTIGPGQFLLEGAFAESLPISSSLLTPTGYLAVTVAATPAGKVGTFLRPGSEIAVYATIPEISANSGQPQQRTILVSKKVKVIAVGSQGFDTAPESVAVDGESLITLALSPADAPRVIHASQIGSLYFGLLSQDTIVNPIGVTSAELVNSGQVER